MTLMSVVTVYYQLRIIILFNEGMYETNYCSKTMYYQLRIIILFNEGMYETHYCNIMVVNNRLKTIKNISKISSLS